MVHSRNWSNIQQSILGFILAAVCGCATYNTIPSPKKIVKQYRSVKDSNEKLILLPQTRWDGWQVIGPFIHTKHNPITHTTDTVSGTWNYLEDASGECYDAPPGVGEIRFNQWMDFATNQPLKHIPNYWLGYYQPHSGVLGIYRWEESGGEREHWIPTFVSE